jgi:hypothetical protein
MKFYVLRLVAWLPNAVSIESYFMDVWRKKYFKTKYDILRSPYTGLQRIKSLIYDRFCN